MKIHEVREMKTDEIRKQVEVEKKNLVDLRFSHQLKQLTNTAKLKYIKKDIARMETVLKERESELVKVDVNKEGAKS
jgi:large subunit ribosomal protein L29